WPGRCPTCGHELCVEPSLPSRDATCPRCGSLVWLSQVVRATSIPRPSKPARGLFKSHWVMRLLMVLTILQGTLVVAVLVRVGFELTSMEFLLLVVLALLLFGRRAPSLIRWVRHG